MLVGRPSEAYPRSGKSFAEDYQLEFSIFCVMPPMLFQWSKCTAPGGISQEGFRLDSLGLSLLRLAEFGLGLLGSESLEHGSLCFGEFVQGRFSKWSIGECSLEQHLFFFKGVRGVELVVGGCLCREGQTAHHLLRASPPAMCLSPVELASSWVSRKGSTDASSSSRRAGPASASRWELIKWSRDSSQSPRPARPWARSRRTAIGRQACVFRFLETARLGAERLEGERVDGVWEETRVGGLLEGQVRRFDWLFS